MGFLWGGIISDPTNHNIDHVCRQHSFPWSNIITLNQIVSYKKIARPCLLYCCCMQLGWPINSTHTRLYQTIHYRLSALGRIFLELASPINWLDPGQGRGRGGESRCATVHCSSASEGWELCSSAPEQLCCTVLQQLCSCATDTNFSSLPQT